MEKKSQKQLSYFVLENGSQNIFVCMCIHVSSDAFNCQSIE